MGFIADAQQLVDRLQAAGITATADPAAADTNRPCVLVAPPSVDYRELLATWRLVALAAADGGSLDALRQLDDLVHAVVDDSDLPVESAEPGAYTLAGSAVPAYILRVTTT